VTLRLGAFAVLVAVLVVIVAFALHSCGGNSKTGQPTDVPLPTNLQGTPYSFAEFRDQFANRLDAIGPELGSVPPDIREEHLVQCGLLANYADRDTVAQLCNAINQAFTRNDPGLMDLVVAELAELKAK